jgi:hypothetical protein
VVFAIESVDGLRRTYLHVNGAVGDFLFAARLKTPWRHFVATQCLRSPGPNVHYSACLASNIEQMFATGARDRLPWAPPRGRPAPHLSTLIKWAADRAGWVQAGGALMETPELARVWYSVGPESLHTRV